MKLELVKLTLKISIECDMPEDKHDQTQRPPHAQLLQMAHAHWVSHRLGCSLPQIALT